MIVVQRVVTSWTKQSRGGGAAARRNAVPEAFPVHVPDTADVFVHEVEACERDDFVVIPAVRTLDRLPEGDPSPPREPGGQDAEPRWGVAGVAGMTRKTRDALAVRDAVAPVTRGVFLREVEGRLDVVVSPPAARSPSYGPRRLFALEPGQCGRWRFNGRFTPDGCGCHSHHWWYEKWVVHVAYVNGTPPVDLFTRREPTHLVDDFVRLL